MDLRSMSEFVQDEVADLRGVIIPEPAVLSVKVTGPDRALVCLIDLEFSMMCSVVNTQEELDDLRSGQQKRTWVLISRAVYREKFPVTV